MNLNEAIERHTEWKITFRAAIEKKSHMDADTIRRDNCCVLGKWLHAAGVPNAAPTLARGFDHVAIELALLLGIARSVRVRSR